MASLFEIVKFEKIDTARFAEIKRLLQSDSCTQEELDKTLRKASGYGYIAVVALLFEKGANVNAKDQYDETALLKASRWGFKKIAKLLLRKGAKVNEEDAHGGIALNEASWSGSMGIVKLLLRKGAKVNEKNKRSGRTALCEATFLGHKNIIELLLENGADANVKDYWGMSALDVAATYNYKDIVKLLLQNGAGATIVKNNLRTAWHIAKDSGFTEIAELLKKHENLHKTFGDASLSEQLHVYNGHPLKSPATLTDICRYQVCVKVIKEIGFFNQNRIIKEVKKLKSKKRLPDQCYPTGEPDLNGNIRLFQPAPLPWVISCIEPKVS